MPKKAQKKVTVVREHPLRVPISKKNPTGITIRDRHPDPPENKVALGITQITKDTLKILKDPNGESKDFIFTKIRQKDLKDPNIAIPMGVRWLFRKRATATNKLKRHPDHEELILEYKGLLKSKTNYKNNALKKFREVYADLKKK